MFELALSVAPTDHALGDSNAAVTLVEYGDFECPNCKQAAPVVKHLLAGFAGRIRIVYRHFPLVGVHPHALRAALASEGAGAQHKFWQMHDLLFENQSHLKEHQLRRYAQLLELDMTRYEADMKGEIYLQRVREHIESGEHSGVRATPTFFINGVVHDVSFGVASLADGIKLALRA